MTEKPIRTPKTTAKPVIGWREWVSLPQLGIERIKAKVDTGARTSALHAWAIEPYECDNELWVRFQLHPIQRNNRTVVSCTARVIDRRAVRNTGGKQEMRYVITTGVTLGNVSWPIEVTLTNRDKMGFRLLLGRTAVKNRFLINAGRSYLSGRKSAG
ncbi:ATP-dependent zinc protease [Magnetovibrio sp.]|uniref:ATP-dependent zinc protease family protein n=1 Tax=Magnetovibrio sp. TaxID=2024836 RepID=UPI002F920D05